MIVGMKTLNRKKFERGMEQTYKHVDTDMENI